MLLSADSAAALRAPRCAAAYRVAPTRRASEESELAERAALITGGSSGIGLAIARALGEDGYALTISARRPEKLEAAAEELRGDGIEVQSVPANMTRRRTSSAWSTRTGTPTGASTCWSTTPGSGSASRWTQIQTKHLDMQLGVNLRALVIGTREALPMLREAGAEHGKALIVNTASIAGKSGQAWLSVYAATKAAVINFTRGDPEGARRRRGSSARRWRRGSSTRR